MIISMISCNSGRSECWLHNNRPPGLTNLPGGGKHSNLCKLKAVILINKREKRKEIKSKCTTTAYLFSNNIYI